ncbi:MAG: hypothetical protein AAFV53_27095 [Myxococcota bacterium]
MRHEVVLRRPDPRDLAALDDEALYELVSLEARGEVSAPVAAMLREPDNLRRWHASLKRIMQEIQHQYVTRKPVKPVERVSPDEWTAYRRQEAAYSRWKRKVESFKKSVAQRLTECKRLLHEQHSKTARAAPLSGKLHLFRRALALLHDAAERVHDDPEWAEWLERFDDLLEHRNRRTP